MTLPPNAAKPIAKPSPGATPGTRGRIIGLDGVRGLSCLGVAVMHLCAHFSPHTAARWHTNLVGLSLILFYVLSGFLLFLPYVRNLTEDRASAALPSTKDFAIHRIARIIPGYLAIFLLCNFVLQVAYLQNASIQQPGTDHGTGMITSPGLLLANLTLVQSYIPEYFQTGLNPSWSLTLEYAFYATLPLLGLLLFALRKRTSMRPLMLAALAPVILIVIGFIGRAFIPVIVSASHLSNPLLIDWGPTWAAVFSKSFLTNSDSFAFGMLAALVVVAIERQSSPKRGPRVRTYSALALLPGVVLLALLTRTPYGTSVIAVLFALLILIIVAPMASGQNSTLARAFDVAPVRFIGTISLSAYLWHFPLMLVLGRLGWMAGDTLGGMIRNVILGLAVTVVVSTGTYYAVEKPAMEYARRYRRRAKARQASAAADAA
jgi:peptidoglycan/LPS O-acetylase OafA/YrhL